jgi:hypothetical protein
MSIAAGQRVRCVKQEPWLDWGERRIPGPAFGELCLVEATHEPTMGSIYLTLAGWEGIFDAAYFEPVEDGADA